MLAQQIIDIKNVDFEKDKAEQICLLENQLFELTLSVVEYHNKIDEANKNIETYNKKLESLSTHKTQEKIDIIKRKVQKLENEKKIKNLQYIDVAKKYDGEVKKIKDEEAKIETEKKLLQSDLRETNNKLAAFEKQLHDYIECPKCAYKFSLKSPDITIKEIDDKVLAIKLNISGIEERIKNNENLQEVIETRKKAVNDNIIKDREQLKIDIDKLSKDIIQTMQSLVPLNAEMNKISTEIDEIDNNIQKERTVIKNTQQLILNSEKQEKDINEAINFQNNRKNEGSVENLEKQIEELNEAIEIYEEAKIGVANEKTEIIKWQIRFKSFKSFLANKSISAINIYINDFLEKIGSNLSVLISGYKQKSDGTLSEKINIEVFRNMRSEGNFNKLSNGEKGRIDICSVVSLQNLINLASPYGGLDFLGCDEILDSMDSYGLDLLKKSLQTLNRTIFIITQVDVNTTGEDVIIAQKQNDITELIMS